MEPMDQSFSQYRSGCSGDSNDLDSSDPTEINDSYDSSFQQRLRKDKLKNIKKMIILDSGSEDCDDDTETDTTNVSWPIKPLRKLTRKIFSDSESSAEENDDDLHIDEGKKERNSKKKMFKSDSESSDVSCNSLQPENNGDMNKSGSTSNLNENDDHVELEEDKDDVDDMNMTMSAATRMSMFGVKTLGADSDDSDFILSEDEFQDLAKMLPDVRLAELSCNPKVKSSPKDFSKEDKNLDDCSSDKSDISLSEMLPNPHIGFDSSLKSSPKSPKSSALVKKEVSSPLEKALLEMSIDEDQNDIIELSSDEEVVDVDMGTPSRGNKNLKPLGSSPKQAEIKTIFQRDLTYPNSQVMYVTKQIKENEINRLNGLKEDLNRVKFLLESLNMKSLPDDGIKLEMRRDELLINIKKQAEKISNMIISEVPATRAAPAIELIPISKKHEGLLSWEELNTGSAAVQPRMFGTQAMNTHNAQKSMTLERLRDLHSSLGTRPDETKLASPPSALKTPLMTHQLHALAWLVWRETQKPRGGILADDMGLGKTLTMISLILFSKENNIDPNEDDENDDIDENDEYPRKGKLSKGGTLVVCPASLLRQWHGEIQNHCKKHVLKVEIHHGLKREIHPNRLARNDVVITTYNLVQRDLEKSGTLMRIRWARVILDEAHIVRNHKALTSRAVFHLASQYRWCLTGTPVHNKDLDLFALLKFLRCTPFDDIVLWKKWIDNKSTGGQERLAAIMKTLLLRRTKQQLQEQKSLGCLPTKEIHLIEVKLSKEEMNVYQKVLVFSKSLFSQFLHQRSQRENGTPSFASKNQNSGGDYDKMHKRILAIHGGQPVKAHEILVLLLRLRQICCHPGLIHSMLDDEQYEENLDNSQIPSNIDLLSEISKLNILEEENHPNDSNSLTVAAAVSRVLSVSNPVFNLEKQSSKIEATMNCLTNNVFSQKGDKAVVVSQWTGMLSIVELNLKKAGVSCTTLSGKVPVTARHEIVKQFNEPGSKTQVLLLSLCAGGVGLNLVGGNHLILLDLHWNPQLEAQAQDRIYRVGQTKPVHIYKLVCKETVESTIKLLQDKKVALAESVLTGAKNIQSSKLSIEELKLMFNMQ